MKRIFSLIFFTILISGLTLSPSSSKVIQKDLSHSLGVSSKNMIESTNAQISEKKKKKPCALKKVKKKVEIRKQSSFSSGSGAWTIYNESNCLISYFIEIVRFEFPPSVYCDIDPNKCEESVYSRNGVLKRWTEFKTPWFDFGDDYKIKLKEFTVYSSR